MPGSDDQAGSGKPATCVKIAVRRSVRLSRRQIDAVAALAEEIRARDPRIGGSSFFGEKVVKGCGRTPKILLGDSGEIPLMLEARHNRVDYRFGFLAGKGDLVVVGNPRNADFERYQSGLLGTSRLDYLGVDPIFGGRYRSIPTACLRDDAVYEKLRRFTAGNGGATLFAFLTTGTIWALAARLAADTGYEIHVAGPPPLLSLRANNKLWFGAVAARLFGDAAIPSKREAHNMTMLVRHVAELSRKWNRLVIKVPDSAGSAGNHVLEADAVRGLGPKALHEYLLRNVAPRIWSAPFPLAVEVWDMNVVTSPSVQVWIPCPEDGEPVIEGVFEQILVGVEGEFAGAIGADLPEGQDRVLCEQAFLISLLFQELGYFGRCSFDAVFAEGGPDGARLHWIECNARWGGVSIPMSFVNAVGSRADYVIVQYGKIATAPRTFDAALEATGDMAPPGDFSSGVVLMSPNVIETGTGCHFLSLGGSAEAAVGQARRVLRRLEAR